MHYFIKHIFLSLSIAFLILSLWSTLLTTDNNWKDSSWEKLVFVLDVSQSMNVADVENGTRLKKAKNFIYEWLTKYEGYEFALTIFAGESQRVLPFTHDISLVATFVEWLDSSNIIEQWTDINAALETALLSFSEDEVWGSIIILTDGSDDTIHISESIRKQIFQDEIQIFFVWIWSEKWAYIPSWDFFEPYKIYEGQRVISRLNTLALESLAQELWWEYHENISDISLSAWDTNKQKTQFYWLFILSALCWGGFILFSLKELYGTKK